MDGASSRSCNWYELLSAGSAPPTHATTFVGSVATRRHNSKKTMTSDGDAPTYVLGHSAEELGRLISQSRFLGDLTEDVTSTLGSLLPMAERLGVVTAAEVQIETLADRL